MGRVLGVRRRTEETRNWCPTSSPGGRWRLLTCKVLPTFGARLKQIGRLTDIFAAGVTSFKNYGKIGGVLGQN